MLALSARRAQTQPHAEGWAALCQALHDAGARERHHRRAAAQRARHRGAPRRRCSTRCATRPRGGSRGAAGDAAAAASTALGARCAAEVADAARRCAAPISARCSGREAAKRWDGPGGWALRAGGLGLARPRRRRGDGARNPLIAAGTAAGALAAEQVQRALREQRVADADALVPSGTEFAAWYAEALSPARVARRAADRRARRARRAAASDAAHAAGRRRRSRMPGARLLDRDLPAAAERSWLRFVALAARPAGVRARRLGDLPGGAPASSPAPTPASTSCSTPRCCSLAYLFAVRFVVRRGLAARARRLLADVTARPPAPSPRRPNPPPPPCAKRASSTPRHSTACATWRPAGAASWNSRRAAGVSVQRTGHCAALQLCQQAVFECGSYMSIKRLKSVAGNRPDKSWPQKGAKGAKNGRDGSCVT